MRKALAQILSAEITARNEANGAAMTPEQQLKNLQIIRIVGLLEICVFPWIMLAVLPMALGGGYSAEPPYVVFKDFMGAATTAGIMVAIWFSGMSIMFYCSYVEKKLREQLGLTPTTDKSNPITRNVK